VIVPPRLKMPPPLPLAVLPWLLPLRLRRASAFAHELRLRFLFGFARQRIAERHHG
jgi:hypothetical protein